MTHEHLVVRAIARAFAAVGRELPGLRLRCTNCIPHGGGLGSSASAIVAGLLLGRELLVARWRPSADRPGRSCSWAPRWKATPTTSRRRCSAGSRWRSSMPMARRWRSAATVHPDIRVIVFSAHQASSTHHTRGLLPAMVPHADASANAAAAGLLVHALTVDPAYLLPATRDRLHQDYRAPAMPASARLVGGPPAVRDRRRHLRCGPVGDRAGHRRDRTWKTGNEPVSRWRKSLCVRPARRFTLTDVCDTLATSCSAR